jgi:hypothetical protein
MGVIKELLLLPLAPVRGTVWIAEQLAEEAERQLDPRAATRRALLELEGRHAAGEIDDDEFDRLEDEILRETTTTRSGGPRYGGLDQEDDAGPERLALPVAQRRDEALDEYEHPQADDRRP